MKKILFFWCKKILPHFFRTNILQYHTVLEFWISVPYQFRSQTLGERLTSYSFNGIISREWVLNSHVKYMKMLPGPIGAECLLLATESGAVYKIFLDSSFPIEIQKINCPIYLCDLSQFRRKLLIVDEHNILSVFDLRSNELLFQVKNDSNCNWIWIQCYI